MLVRVAKKYQLTIPKGLRASLTIAPGDTLHGSFSEGALRLSSRPRHNPDEPEVEVKVRERFQITLPAHVFRSRGVRVGHVVDVVRLGDAQIAIYPSVALSWRDPTQWPELIKRAEEFRPAGLAEHARWRKRR